MDRVVFLNYRGEDSHNTAAWLYSDLTGRFGKDLVFLDAESIPAGADYVTELVTKVRTARVVLAVIGPGWLTATDPATPGAGRRIDDPRDWIRRELVEAFAAGVRVVPILIDDAVLPSAAELPADIARLARCQARRLRRRDPVADLDRLAEDLIAMDPDLAAVTRGTTNGTGWTTSPVTGTVVHAGSVTGGIHVYAARKGRHRTATTTEPGSRKGPVAAVIGVIMVAVGGGVGVLLTSQHNAATPAPATSARTSLVSTARIPLALLSTTATVAPSITSKPAVSAPTNRRPAPPVSTAVSLLDGKWTGTPVEVLTETVDGVSYDRTLTTSVSCPKMVISHVLAVGHPIYFHASIGVVDPPPGQTSNSLSYRVQVGDMDKGDPRSITMGARPAPIRVQLGSATTLSVVVSAPGTHCLPATVAIIDPELTNSSS